VAAQIVTGIGFLGAGAILHSRGGVTGMTTAATIWVAAAVGMTIGTGYPVAGLGACLLIRVVLAGIREWEIQHLGGMRTATIEIVFNPDFGKTRVRLERLRSEARVAAPIEEQESLEGGLVRARIGLRLTNNSYCEFLGSVVDLPQVKEIREVS
jgi:putative Mg2+ transporter-C (MgtC) family protein